MWMEEEPVEGQRAEQLLGGQVTLSQDTVEMC